MSDIIFGVSLGLILFFLLIGFLVGLIRGVKRSAVHIAFVVVSILIAFFVTRPIVNAVLGISITIDGSATTISDYILTMVNDNVIDLSNFDSASTFIQALPSAIANPIVFMVVMILVYFVIDIIYLIVARIAFGKKKNDFAEHKAHRLPGGLVGIVEACLFVFVFFAPITSLTATYSDIISQSGTSAVETETATDDRYLKSIGALVSENMPTEVDEIINSFNDSAIGRVCSIGGINNLLFDELSNIKVDGEKIKIRDEIISIADSYDSFVVVYNNFIDQDYENLEFSSLKDALTRVIENNLFKTVLSDTIGDLVVNFKELDPEFTDKLPDLARDIIVTLQTRFSSEGFDAYEYLSHDLLKMLDIFETVVESGKIETFINFNSEDTTSSDIINMITDNSDLLSDVLLDFVDLNLMNDTLPIVLDYLNQTIESKFENDQGLTVALNADISNEEFKSTISTLFDGDKSILAQLNQLEKNYNILAMLDAENALEFLLDIENIDLALAQFGAIMDDLNGLELLSFTDTTGKEIKSLENILKISGINVLGDTVTVKTGDVYTTTQLNTYEEFFTYISAPIKKIVEANLADLIDDEINFDNILNTLTSAISGESEGEEDLYFLADILMPFYELDQSSLAGQSLDMVFVQITDLLKENLGDVLDLSTTAETENYQTWETRLVSVATIFDILNSGEMPSSDGQSTVTYLKYLLGENVDYFELMKSMNADGSATALLNTIFGNTMYNKINSQIFSMVDRQIADFTGVYVETDITNLYEEKDSYISLITSIVSYLDDGQFDNADLTTQLTAIGGILNELRTSAQNGVMNEVFANLIWYMTGEVIDTENADAYANKTTPFEYADKVKEYLNADSVVDGYYGIDYLAEVEGLVDFIELGNDIVENLNQVDLSTDTGRQQFVASLEETINTFEDPQAVVDKAVEIANVVLNDEQLAKIQAQSADMITAINESTALNDDIKASLLELFGLNQQ